MNKSNKSLQDELKVSGTLLLKYDPDHPYKGVFCGYKTFSESQIARHRRNADH